MHDKKSKESFAEAAFQLVHKTLDKTWPDGVMYAYIDNEEIVFDSCNKPAMPDYAIEIEVFTSDTVNNDLYFVAPNIHYEKYLKNNAYYEVLYEVQEKLSAE